MIFSAHLALAAGEGPNITLVKFYGDHFGPVNLTDVVLRPDGFHITQVLHADENGHRIPETYLPRNGAHAHADNLSYMQRNPLENELDVQKNRLIGENCRLLVAKQLFPMMVYEQRNILSPQEIIETLTNSKKLVPDSITFATTSRVMSEKEVLETFGGKIPEFAYERPNYRANDLVGARHNMSAVQHIFKDMLNVPDFITDGLQNTRTLVEETDSTKYYDVVSSTSWIVGGQTPATVTNPHGIAYLPLEYTKLGLKETSAREKYEAVWEVGRSAKIGFHDDDMWYALYALTDQMSHESALLGVPEEQAGALGHSGNRGIKRLHTSVYGLEYLEDHPDKEIQSVQAGTIAHFRGAIQKQLAIIDPTLSHLPDTPAQIRNFLDQPKPDFHMSNQSVHVRDFKAYRERRMVPPTTPIEHYATISGARDPQALFSEPGKPIDNSVFDFETVQLRNGKVVKILRRDRLRAIMTEYFHGQSSLKEGNGMDIHSFMKSLFLQYNALVLDLERDPTALPLERDWVKILSQAASYADQHGIENIAIPAVQGDPLPALHVFDTVENTVLHRPQQAHLDINPGQRTIGQENIHFIPEEKIMIYWLKTKKLLASPYLHPEPIQIQNPVERYWPYALYSEKPAETDAERWGKIWLRYPGP